MRSHDYISWMSVAVLQVIFKSNTPKFALRIKGFLSFIFRVINLTVL